MGDLHTVLLTCAAGLAIIYLVRWRTNPLNKIPTVGGPSAPGFSYYAALNFMFNGRKIIHQGYQKFQNSAFKIATFDQWQVVVCGPRMIEELRRRPDHELSFIEGVEETLQFKYTIGMETIEDPYHLHIMKEKLPRMLPLVLPDVVDELGVAIQEHIPLTTNEWTTVKAVDTLQKIVAQTSNRVFVGLPTCRNRAFLDLAVAFTMTVVKDRMIINIFPTFMKSLVGRLISQTNRSVAKALTYLQPVIDERRAKSAELGDEWSDKPNDMLQWLMDESTARKNKSGDYGIVQRVLLVNFAAIHTSTVSLTEAVYDLAARPEYIQPLRDEAEQVIAAEGWTKNGMSKLWKLDSFLKESLRFQGNITSLARKAVKDVTFNDGTFIPSGTVVVAAADPTHHDERYYANPSEFDGFRFARLREGEGESAKHQYVNTSTEYIPFGHGKHACPGRFFAANELKAILAYIVLHYDLKIPGDGERPRTLYYGNHAVPSFSGEVSFRKRPRASA